MNGDQLKQLRTAQDWSQTRLAELLNASLDRKYGSAMISRWETGKAPIPGHVAAFLDGLELRAAYPLDDERPPVEGTYEDDFPIAGEQGGDTSPPPPSSAGRADGIAALLPFGSSPYARVCEELFELVATGVGLVGAVVGSEALQEDGRIIVADKQALGKAYGKLAETNATFRKMLTGMTGGGAWLEVALVSGITAGKVMRNHQRTRPVLVPDDQPAEEGVTFNGDGSVVHFPSAATTI